VGPRSRQQHANAAVRSAGSDQSRSIVAGFAGTRHWQPGSSLAYFVLQLAGFVTVTGLLLAGGVVPYRPSVGGSERMRLFVSGLEIIWWLGAAWLSVGFLRAFVVLG
jgi:hypothetical protein